MIGEAEINKTQLKTDKTIQFSLLYMLWVFISFKPEWTIPGLKFIAPGITLTQLILLLFWFVYRDKKLDNSITKLFFLFIVLMIVSSMFARNNGLSRDTIRGMALLYITYLGTITFANNERKIYSIFNVFILGGIFIALLSIRDKGLARGVTIYADENDLALAMNIFFSLALFLGIGEKKRLKKVLYFVSCGVFIAPTLISNAPSRGGFLGLAAVLLFAWFKLPINKIKSALIIVIIAAGMFLAAPQSFWDEMQTISRGTEESTAAARVFFWKVAFEEFLDHPILGVGVNNFGVWLPEYAETKVEFDADRMSGISQAYGRVSHSLYFTLLAELGALGVFLFSAMLYRFFNELRFDKKILATLANPPLLKIKWGSVEGKNLSLEGLRKCHALSLGLSGGMIGFLASGTFLTVLYYPQFWLMCSLAVMLGNCRRKILMNRAC